jgi:hypothetical protein
MMKKIYSTILLIFAFVGVWAQVPSFFNTNAAGGANTFPLGNTATSRKVQWFIPPNSLGSVSAGNNITDVYFQTGSNTTNTYPIINVKLKQGSGTGLTGVAAGPVEAGMTLVYSGTNVVLTTTIGAWVKFTLNTPFLYNPASPLIVELEHNATTGGSTVYQAVNIPGPGNGRQWADYNAANITGIGAQQINFGIDVVPAIPCSTTPSSNSVVGPTAAICPNANANMNVTNTYTAASGGIVYQWQSSTTSSVGPFTAIPSATNTSYTAPNVTVATWYNAVITCTNVTGTITSSAYGVSVSPVIIGNVPYLESFEGIGTNNQLPNCSWAASNLPANCQTYISSNTLGRSPRTGNKFASFFWNPGGTRYFYTNGINLVAGVTYSAGLWYQTEFFGYNNWSDLSILYNNTQTPTGTVSIASTNGPAISNIYKDLGGTFTVPSSGIYYFAIRATGSTASSAQYLSWDDLSITIPCGAGSPNTPTVNMSANSNTICEGQSVVLTAVGADTYTWNTGSNASLLTETPNMTTTYSVVGTNTLTGCSQTVTQNVVVNAAPAVFIAANKVSVCAGSPVQLSAIGGSGLTYTWNTGANAAAISASPLTNTTYTVLASNANGCIGAATQVISVNQLPNVQVISSVNGNYCQGEPLLLTASGAISYQWASSSSPNLFVGNPLPFMPMVPTTYTVIGTDANGCQKAATLTQNVDICAGIQQVGASVNGIKLYPNPTKFEFTIETKISEAKSIQVTDVSGRIIIDQNSSKENVKLNLNGYATGIYYVKIQSDSYTEVIKLVKE